VGHTSHPTPTQASNYAASPYVRVHIQLLTTDLAFAITVHVGLPFIYTAYRTRYATVHTETVYTENARSSTRALAALGAFRYYQRGRACSDSKSLDPSHTPYRGSAV
jgi:hypothetical protein